MTPKRAQSRPWQDRFLTALAQTGVIARACKAAGVSRKHAYETRETNPTFRAAWDDAKEEAGDVMEAEAFRRAVKGTLEPVFYKGEECGEVRKYSDVLLMFLLKGNRPEKFRERPELILNRDDLDRAIEHELARVAGRSQAEAPAPTPGTASVNDQPE